MMAEPIAWLNLALLVGAMALTLVFYVLSVRPAALARRIGPGAYRRCARYRLVAGLLMFLEMAGYVLYFFFPLPIPLPRTFPWPWWVSALIGAAIAFPAGYMLARGMMDAGEETMVPKEEHRLYGGIYERVRHPQAWEAALWLTIAFLLHSPFLALFSVLWLPVEYLMVKAEEGDLVLRYGQAYEEYRRRTPAFLPHRRGGQG
jgi:protein-S-isoprenylcysteine O-methyltransferase Ste14